MNVVREIQKINEKELESNTRGSWHDQYKDSAYIYVSGLDYQLTEGDVITVCSQYGEVSDVNMPRDKQTGKSRGFAFVMYEDQRSTVLAVDNLNGSTVAKRTIRVDHVAKYKQLERDPETGKMREREQQSLNALPSNFENNQASDADSDADSTNLEDPMAAYLLEQKKKSKKQGTESKEERMERKRLKQQRKEERDARRREKEMRKEKRGREKQERKTLSTSSSRDYRHDREREGQRRSASYSRSYSRSRSRSRSRSPHHRSYRDDY